MFNNVFVRARAIGSPQLYAMKY